MKQADNSDHDELRPEYQPEDFAGAVRGKFAGRVPAHRLTLRLECEQLRSGRWLARIDTLQGFTAYADSRERAVRSLEGLAVAAIADQVRSGKIPPTGLVFAISTIRATPRHTPN